MKLCANISTLFTEYTLLDRFSAALDCGFSGVEIQFPYSASISDLVNAQTRSGSKTSLINIAAGDLLTGGEGLACVPKQRDAFKRAVEQCLTYAQELSVEQVNVLSGRCLDSSQSERYYDTFLNNLEYASDQLQSINVGTVFEAINTIDMPHFLIHNVDQMQQVMSDLNHSNLSMQYDIYHMAKMNEPIIEQLPNIVHQIGHIQFADTPDRHEPNSGKLTFTEIFQTIKASNYQGWLGAEYHPTKKTEKTLDWMDLALCETQ